MNYSRKHFSLALIFCTAIACLLVIACTSSGKNTQQAESKVKNDIDISIPGSFEPEGSIKFDSSFGAAFLSEHPGLSAIKNEWQQFYTGRNYSFAWFNESGLTAAAQNLHNRINNLQDDGLDSSLPYRTEFNKLFDESAASEGASGKDSLAVRTEMMLTAQYLLYAKNIYDAMGAAELRKLGWNINRKNISFNEYLNQVLQNGNGDSLFANEPVYRQYNMLKEYLRKYRLIAEKGGWPMVDTSIKKLKPGDSSAAIKQIKARLFMSGDFPDSISDNKFDQKLAAAVKLFRARHGLKDTALIEKSTTVEMNVPVEKRIGQILVNMERCRWLPSNPGPDYITVNIPAYRMMVYEKDSFRFGMDVVVGQTANKTVIFSDTLQTIAFSPYWNVPNSIYRKEIAGRGSGYLRRNNMEMVNGQVRQRPGGNNALGKVKFLFPNSYNIYFHDTPAKDKFNYQQRTFSHGCIRIAEPRKLAIYLLRNEPKYTEKIIDSLMNMTKETQVSLKKRLPVYIIYMTAYVTPQGLQFRKDVYKQDQAVMDRIAGR